MIWIFFKFLIFKNLIIFCVLGCIGKIIWIFKSFDILIKVLKTIYPGLENHPQYDIAKKQMLQPGSIITFLIKGNNAFQFMNSLNLFDISNNFGDTKSLVTHPATTTHRVIGEKGRKELNISDNMIRLSIGLEDVEDLIDDINQEL